MAVQLNHTIVNSHDSVASARFMSDVFGLPEPTVFGPFQVIEAANGVSLDFIDVGDDGVVHAQHYAFLVAEDEFDSIFARVVERGLDYWADPGHSQPGRINHHYGGRGVYFDSPDGHFLEIITTPYGSEP
ncbi:MAG: VOC family protein [Actinobacteria bacterium]|nr:VOC family protein [Actinomycetota bacterium]